MIKIRKFIDRLINRWDWWIYARAVNSVRRMCKLNDGFAYLFVLQLQDYMKENPIPEELKDSTERFYESLKNIVKNKV